MKKQAQSANTKELKAETLLLQMELDPNLYFAMEGVFFRNFSEDLMNIEQLVDYTSISLSRDGIFQLLPEGLFFEEKKLKSDGKRFFDFNEKYEEIKKKKKELLDFFQPFDASFFKTSLELERKLNAFAEAGNEILQNSILNEAKSETRSNIGRNFLQKPETDKYSGKIKKLLPFASQIRGNLPLLADLLKNIFSVHRIEIKETEPFIKHFFIYKEGLSQDEYLTMNRELIPFFDFLRHWFLPVELTCHFQIKDIIQPFILGETLILDYNTDL